VVRRAAEEVIFFQYAGGYLVRLIPPPEQVAKCARQWWVRYEADLRHWWRENEPELIRRSQHPPR
jgi:hypothetical protein